ncbi:MAG: transposase [Deltaproteobacteria bacterium]|nr:transposase [Deltaproteobacteria bacterium]
MADRAAAWIEGLLPRVAVRQWVLTVPFRRRWLLACRTDLARGALAVALDRIGWLRDEAEAPSGCTGSVTVVQRFASALDLNLHFHVLQLDGLYVRDRGGRRSFLRVRPRQRDVENLVIQVASAVEAADEAGAPACYGDFPSVDAMTERVSASRCSGTTWRRSPSGGFAVRRSGERAVDAEPNHGADPPYVVARRPRWRRPPLDSPGHT